MLSIGCVAKHFRCGGIISDNFIANFPESVSMKEFWKLFFIRWSYDRSLVVSYRVLVQQTELNAVVSDCIIIHTQFLFKRPIFLELFEVRLRLVPKSKLLRIVVAEILGRMPFLSVQLTAWRHWRIKYFYVIIYQTYTLRYRRERTRPHDCMTFVYVYVVNRKVNWKLIRKFFIPRD